MNITNLKCREDGNRLRVTWNWPPKVDHVYVNGQLFTAQEYRKMGGFFADKKFGVSTFNVNDTEVSFTRKIKISANSRIKKSRQYVNHELTFTAEADVPADIICYEAGGTIYFFGEELEAGKSVMRIVRTAENGGLRVFISDENAALYEFNRFPTGTG